MDLRLWLAGCRCSCRPHCDIIIVAKARICSFSAFVMMALESCKNWRLVLLLELLLHLKRDRTCIRRKV